MSLGKNEAAIMAAISEVFALQDGAHAASVDEFNALLRARILPRGKRFTHDFPHTCVYIARSKNANVVAYTANLLLTGGAAPSLPPPHAASDETEVSAFPVSPKGVGHPSGIEASCDLDKKHPIHAYFVNLEPSYLASRRRKGIAYDCDELSFLEKKLAYGYTTKPLECDHQVALTLQKLAPAQKFPLIAALRKEQLLALSNWWDAFSPILFFFVALPQRPCLLLRLKPISPSTLPPVSLASTAAAPSFAPADTVIAMVSLIAGEPSVLEKVYVKSTERFMRLPTVEYIDAFGVSLVTGKPVCEKTMHDGSSKESA